MRFWLSFVLLTAASVQAADYWPLDLGATWRYRDQGGFEFDVSVLEATYSCLEPCRVKMNGLLSGEYYAGELFVVGDDGDIYLVGLVHASDDYWIWDCYSEPVLFLDLPLEVGKTWTDMTADAVISAEVTGEEQIVTPAGEYTCMVVSHTLVDFGIYISYDRTFWLNAQLGPVKIGNAELVSYDGIVAAEPITWGSVKSLFR